MSQDKDARISDLIESVRMLKRELTDLERMLSKIRREAAKSEGKAVKPPVKRGVDNG
jgi:hypothetical protein